MSFSDAVLSNTLILNRIFFYLGLRDLKNCSVVNSEWFKEACPYINNKSKICVCTNTLAEFVEMFSNTIWKQKNRFGKLIHADLSQIWRITETDEATQLVQNLRKVANSILVIKLHVTLVGRMTKIYDEIFQLSGSIEDVSIRIGHRRTDGMVLATNENFMNSVSTLQNIPLLPELKTLRIAGHPFNCPDSVLSTLFRKIIKATPNLSSLFFHGQPNAKNIFLKELVNFHGRLEMLQELKYHVGGVDHRFLLNYNFPGLKRFWTNVIIPIKFDEGDADLVEAFTSQVMVVRAILEKCRANLTHLKLDCYHILKDEETTIYLHLPVMPKLDELCIKFMWEDAMESYEDENFVTPTNRRPIVAMEGGAFPKLKVVELYTQNYEYLRQFCHGFFPGWCTDSNMDLMELGTVKFDSVKKISIVLALEQEEMEEGKREYSDLLRRFEVYFSRAIISVRALEE